MSDTVTVTWSFVRLTGLLNAKEGRSHRKRYEHREAGVQQIHDLFVVKINKKIYKISIGLVLKEPTVTTPP